MREVERNGGVLLPAFDLVVCCCDTGNVVETWWIMAVVVGFKKKYVK